MMGTTDGQFIPFGGGRGERQELRSRISEFTEGQQVSYLHYLDEPGPTGSRGIALEFTTGARLICWAGRDRNSQFTARLLFRFMDPPKIIVPRVASLLSFGRNVLADPPDELQREIEGEVIVGIRHSRIPTQTGGEQMGIEFKGGKILAMAAVAVSPTLTADGTSAVIADLIWQVIDPSRTLWLAQ